MTMRSRSQALTALLAGLVLTVACGHEEPARVPTPRLAPPSTGAPSPEGPSSYLVADPSARDAGIRVAIGTPGQFGVVAEGIRAIVGKGEPQLATEETSEPITAAAAIPARLGGGFVFHTDHAIYRSDTFAGPLRALGRTPEVIQAFSFAPKSLLVRCRNGERWAIALPSGDRVPVSPVGVADVEGLDDGRALAFDDQGLAFVSSDHGGHWSEVTSLLRSAPTRVANIRSELWILESGGTAQRLEADGRLAAYDAAPEEDEKSFRAVDPRWRGADTPLRTAFTLGAALDEATALVYADGDLVRVDVRTGDLVSVLPGKLPPGAVCQAIPTSNDVLFACSSPGGGSSGAVTAFLASHAISDAPVVEQSFAGDGRFWASDDGGVAFSATCGATPAPAPSAPPTSGLQLMPTGSLGGHTQACVRQPDGSWRDVEVPSTALPAAAQVTRWVPRADGSAVALLEGDSSGVYDPQSGRFDKVPSGTFDGSGEVFRPRRFKVHRVAFSSAAVVDTAWTLAPSGALRGYLARGGSVEISPGGRVSRSPFVLESLHAGALALGRTEDGRLFQTTDHGASWTEVLAPPAGLGRGLHACTTAGCDLGAFYRVGWSTRAPRAHAPRTKTKPAGDVRRVRAPELTCRATGAASFKAAPRSPSSPEDLGLGASRVPYDADHGDVFLRLPVTRGLLHPVHDMTTGDSDGPALRGMLSGYRVSHDGDVPLSAGPVKTLGALRRNVSFLAPFDPSGAVRRSGVLMADVLAAGRNAGMTTDEILSDDMTEAGNLVLVTPRDANAASDMLLHNARGMIASLRAGQDRSRVVVRPPAGDGLVVSAAALPNDELAVLEIETGGPEHVFKVSATGASDLFDVGTNLGDALFYPANPDAIAVGPRGEVGVLRAGSGSEPASELDPALLVLPGSKPKVLAPWSTLEPAEAPACKADTAGFRATLQLVGPWIRTTSPELRADEGAPVLARVKWSETRVCLEGVEIKVPAVSVHAPGSSPGDPTKQASWIVGRGGQWARVAVGEGIEWRQPLECTIALPRP